VKAVLPPEAAGKPLEIWFQDEARVGQKGTLTRLWAEKGTRPRAPRDTRYTSAYIFGAACPQRTETAALVMPRANSEAMNAHLKVISGTVAKGAHAVVVCDQASWHLSKNRLHSPDNITLLPLPAYSPELNPLENVWDYLRKNKLAITVWESYDEIMDACCKAWNFFAHDTDAVRRITTRKYAEAVND